MDQLAITEKDGANYHLYELEGALNAYTLGEFQDTLYDAVQKNNIVLDMSRLIELDASGIGPGSLGQAIAQEHVSYQHDVRVHRPDTFPDKIYPRFKVVHSVNLINVEVSKYHGERQITQRGDQKRVALSPPPLIENVGVTANTL